MVEKCLTHFLSEINEYSSNLKEKEMLQNQQKGIIKAMEIVRLETDKQSSGKTCCVCRDHFEGSCDGTCSSKKEKEKVFCPSCLGRCWRCNEKAEGFYCEPCQEWSDSQ